MSRSLLNFLIFEDLFDNLNTSNLILVDLAKQIFMPSVRIVSENCGTKLGKVIAVTPEINGKVRIDFNGILDANRMVPEAYRISQSDIEGWLSKSIYSTKVRDLHHCAAVGGVCATCYASTLNLPAPVVGLSTTIRNQYVLHEDSFFTSDSSKSYLLSTDSETYDFQRVFLGNRVLAEKEFSFLKNTITPLISTVQGELLRVESIIYSNKPFMNYLASTYSGSLLGLKSIAQQPITLPIGNIDRGISEGKIALLLDQVEKLGTVDQSMLDYYHTVTNKLEKSLLLITLASIYNDIQT